MNKSDTRQKAGLDWGNLPFGYVKTDYNIRYFYKDGAWSGGQLVGDEKIGRASCRERVYSGV